MSQKKKRERQRVMRKNHENKLLSLPRRQIDKGEPKKTAMEKERT